MQHILVVSGDDSCLVPMLRLLDEAGYKTSGASTFEEAKEILTGRLPDLVIADQRLGAYNGLHVIMNARANDPGVGGIVTTPARNRGVEADARGLDVDYMVTPPTAAEWLGPISKALNSGRRVRAAS